jgi:hypothetical protein
MDVKRFIKKARGHSIILPPFEVDINNKDFEHKRARKGDIEKATCF